MEQKIKELIEISRFYGVDKEYVIAGGGNTSCKSEDKLWIKASGVALSDITETGFVQMSRDKLKVISQKQYSDDSTKRETEVKEDMLSAIIINNGLRPSVETSLHEIVNYTFVIHTHPTLVNSLMCSKYAKEKSFELLGDDIMFVSYIDPGYVLFKNVADSLNQYKKEKRKDPKIILLENHGIIVSANSIEEVKAIYTDIENKILDATPMKLPSLDISEFDISNSNVLNKIYDGMVISAISNELIQSFVHDVESFELVKTAFTPDHIVYCKSRYLFIEEHDNIELKVNSFKMQFGYLPKIIGVKGKGLLIIDDSLSAIKIITELILNMMKISYYAAAFGGSKPMTDSQIAFIENWEAENYRKKMAEKK